MGRLIPAGTGLPAYKRLTVLIEGEPVPQAYVPPRPRPEEAPLVAVNED